MFSIGEFSKITGLSIKALRLYHEKGALYYDEGFKEEDADIETCYPVREGREIPAREGIAVRVLPGGKVVSIVHQGPYDQLGRSYEKVSAYVKQKSCTVSGPPREIYLKGPGMIFRGDPKKYLTEIQIPVSG
jgi:effector-binding domain-containing protein